MLLQGQHSCFPAPFASPLAALCSNCSIPHRGLYIVCPTYQAMWEDGALGCRYPWVLDGLCISCVGSYPLFPRLNVLVCFSSDAVTGGQREPLQRLGFTLSMYESKELGGHKILSVDCYVILRLFLKHANLLQSIIAGEKGCSVLLPRDWRWCLSHQAKTPASLAEPVSSADCWAPPGCVQGDCV